MPKIPRAYSYKDIARKQFSMLPISGLWKEHQGELERSGSILIYGGSGHGKTTYALQFMKSLCKLEKVHYNTVEEGMKASFKRNLKLNGLQFISNQYTFQSEYYEDTVARLQRKRQPKIVFIDSVQYFFRGKKREDYFKLLELFPDTLFVFISHLQKGGPKGAIAEDIQYDSQNVVRVQDFKAFIEKTRCGADETKPYIISKEKAEERELKLLKNG